MLRKAVENYDFKPLSDFLESIYPQIRNESIEQDDMFTTINMDLKNGMRLKTIITEDCAKKVWISFYLKNDSLNIEQIDFMINDSDDNVEFNRVIRHDYYVEGEIATTFNSTYTYLGDNYIHGWEHKRKVYFEDIKHYAGRDNLANFACRIDNSKNNVLYREDNYLVEVPEIKLVMLRESKQKVLEKNIIKEINI